MSAARRLWSRDAPAEAAVTRCLARRDGAGEVGGTAGGGEIQCREEGCRGRQPRLSERAGGSQRWEGPAALGARGRSLAGTPSECVPTEKYHVKQSAESRL